MQPSILQSFCCLFELLEEPEAFDVFLPLLHKEIHYRLLTSNQGHRLYQVSSIGSQSQRIFKVIDWLKDDYMSTLVIE